MCIAYLLDCMEIIKQSDIKGHIFQHTWSLAPLFGQVDSCTQKVGCGCGLDVRVYVFWEVWAKS